MTPGMPEVVTLLHEMVVLRAARVQRFIKAGAAPDEVDCVTLDLLAARLELAREVERRGYQKGTGAP